MDDPPPDFARFGAAVTAALREAAQAEPTEGQHPAALYAAMLSRIVASVEAEPALYREGLAKPLLALGASLHDLARGGRPPPILAPTKAEHRPPASTGKQALMWVAAQMHRTLLEAGMRPDDADARVAAALDREGLAQTEGGKVIERRTIRQWREHVGAPPRSMPTLEAVRGRPFVADQREPLPLDRAKAVVDDLARRLGSDPNMPKKGRS